MEEKGSNTKPIKREVNGWCFSHMTETLWATKGIISIHSLFKESPVLRDPQTRIASVFKQLRRTVTYRIINIQTTNKDLCNGQQKDATKLRPGVVRVTCSKNRAPPSRMNSGKLTKLPGGAQSGSWRSHQAVSRVVADKRRKYACLDSAAAAHSNGIAANPRGVGDEGSACDS
mmetsp:Transcript_1888/g.3948  ORF Transcript_1888/g.3948 Transcript_1888/m.3948 type:complete len:173 (-) Transcript_1888:547-1065(-)